VDDRVQRTQRFLLERHGLTVGDITARKVLETAEDSLGRDHISIEVQDRLGGPTVTIDIQGLVDAAS
jgi:hypothetical protein